MKKEYKIFILIEKILNTLNNSRLEYIKAADKSPYPEYKRFLNKTATTRNRLCQDLMVVFRLYYNAPENLVLSRIDHKINKIKEENNTIHISQFNQIIFRYE